jgi:hypothetical protein
LVRSIRFLIELPLSAFRTDANRAQFVRDCVSGFLLLVKCDELTHLQVSELSALSVALRNRPFVRAMAFDALFREYFDACATATMHFVTQQMLAEFPTSLENWMHFWSVVPDFRCLHNDLAAKVWVDEGYGAVRHFWVNFLIENSDSLLEVAEQDPSWRFFDYAARFFNSSPFLMEALRNNVADSWAIKLYGSVLSECRLESCILIDADLLRAISRSESVSDLHEAAIAGFMHSLLSLSGQILARFSFFHDHCFDLFVLIHRLILNLQFPSLIHRIVEALSFKTFPPFFQQALIASSVLDSLFLCEYWSLFTRDTWGDWHFLTANLVHVLQWSSEKTIPYLQTVKDRLLLHPRFALSSLAICFETTALPQNVLFELFVTHFHSDLSCLIEQRTELSAIASLLIAVVRAGDHTGELSGCSPASVARFRLVHNLAAALMAACEGHQGCDRIPVKLLSLLISVIEQRALNLGVLHFYGDSSFFELANQVVLFCARTDCRENRKLVARLTKFFLSFVDCFDCRLLPLESWDFFVAVLGALLPAMPASEVRAAFTIVAAVVQTDRTVFAQLPAAQGFIHSAIAVLERMPALRPSFSHIESAIAYDFESFTVM